jgi:hypothetical protein
LGRQRSVGFRTPVAIELPNLSYFLDHVEIEIGYQHFIFRAAGLCDDFAARIAEITLTVKFADIPWLLATDPIDGADEITVRRGVRRLLQFPQIFRESRNRGGRIENNFCAVQSEEARTFWKMGVVADVNANASKLRVEYGIK